MPIRWIRVRHAETGGETDIPERSLERYAHRGWFPLAHFQKQAAVETAEPESAREADVRTTKEKK